MLASAPRLRMFPHAARCVQVLLWISVLARSSADAPRSERDSLPSSLRTLRQLQDQPAYNCSSADDDDDPTTTVACCECEAACVICDDYYNEAGCIDGGCVWDAQGGYCGATETCFDDCSAPGGATISRGACYQPEDCSWAADDPMTTVACCECEAACGICDDYFDEAGCIDGG